MTWSMIVDLLRGGLFSLAHFCGGSMGLAIIAASLAFRAVTLPFAIQAARRQAAVPANKRVPDLGFLAQIPVGFALFAAIRNIGDRAGGFLWVRTLARPDRALAILGAIIAGGLSWFAGSAQALNGAPAGSGARAVALALSGLVAFGLTLTFLSHMSAGVAVYSITSSVAGFGERRLVMRLAATKAGAKA
jgi:membrane protein insertase Oxa1/YidC/SpoIIIJ